MWIVLLGLTFGLLASTWASSTQEVKVRGCSHVGVFFIQGKERHSLSFTEAQDLCKELGATLASAEQMQAAVNTGLEMCRYGWIDDSNVTIPRQTSNNLCRAGHTGLIIFRPVEVHYDAFCYDASDISDKNCSLAINLESTVDPIPKEKDNFTTPVPGADNHTDAHNITAILADSDLADEDKNATLAIDLPDTMPLTTTIAYDDHVTQGGDDTQTTQFEIGGNVGPFIENFTQPESHNEQTITLVPVQEGVGSGMGESVTGAQDPNGDSQDTTTHPESMEDTTTVNWKESDSEIPDLETSDKNGRMMLPPDDKSKEESTDWLIIVLVIVAVAGILLVCAAVATRKRWCGKSQTLMITSKSNSEGNGTAASAGSSRAQEREQEMVTLMNKEKIQENGNTEEFTVITLEESPEKNQQA